MCSSIDDYVDSSRVCTLVLFIMLIIGIWKVDKHDEVELDQKISKIRREDQKRLMRQEEVRKDRQRYG